MRFYGGGTPEDWMSVRPHLFAAALQMMDRLEAEESLARIDEVAAGTGLMVKDRQQEYRRDLMRRAHVRQGPTTQATAAGLARIGIKVVGDI